MVFQYQRRSAKVIFLGFTSASIFDNVNVLFLSLSTPNSCKGYRYISMLSRDSNLLFKRINLAKILPALALCSWQQNLLHENDNPDSSWPRRSPLLIVIYITDPPPVVANGQIDNGAIIKLHCGNAILTRDAM